MTKEQAFLIQILSDFILEKQTEPVEIISWQELISCAERQQVSGILFAQCKDFLPREYHFDLLKANMFSLHIYENRKHFLELFSQETEKAKIPFFVVKGTAVAEYYPIPAQRTMGDTDIVVRTEDRENAHRIMLALGCERVSSFEDREWIYHKDRMTFELHDRLVYSETVTRHRQENYFNNFWSYYQSEELDWNFHFLFLIAHLRKHFLNSGVGFRQFMDLAVLVKNNPQLDFSWIEAELEKLDLSEFARTCLAFCERWFGVPSPLTSVDIEEVFLKKSTQKIFADGIFGFDNEANLKNDAVNRARKAKHNRISMLLTVLRRVFPPYQAMVLSGNYDFLKGKPLLLPFAWVYRFYRGVRYRYMDDGKQLAENAFVSSKQLEERIEMLEKWGL